MNVKQFDKLTARDFENGAVRDEIRTALAALEERDAEIHEKYKAELITQNDQLDRYEEQVAALQAELEEGRRAWAESDEHKNADELREANEKLVGEIAALQRWKDEALEVEASWDCQAVGKAIGTTLGGNIRKDILPFILKQKARIKELEGALGQIVNYAQCQVDAFSSGNPHLDMTGFPHLIKEANSILGIDGRREKTLAEWRKEAA